MAGKENVKEGVLDSMDAQALEGEEEVVENGGRETMERA